MISLDQVSKTFPATRRTPQVDALVDVSMLVETGQVMGVVGPSGSGKSTLARCINLLERPTSGTVTVDGTELTALRRADLNQARRSIGMIFQQFNLLDSRTALANVELPLELAGLPAAERRTRAFELLDRVGLADKAHTHPAQLSGGQRQRVAIARALAPRPKVLLCDEATSALDPQSTASVLGLVRDLTAELGLTTVLITHEMDVVKAVCDSVTLLEDGVVVDAGALTDLASRSDSPLATRLLPPLSHEDRHGVVELTLAGDGVDAVLTDLARRFPVEVHVLEAAVQRFGGQRFGRVLLRLGGPDAAVTAATAYLTSHRTPVLQAGDAA
ncbi:methionine ABC transporter ATP-binding protein [Ornithinimicrobium flavum]|uniref:methionine ABC transporter ATP-binding protein n=1 Tax=Ornithinimicrobium flavum TaxID=1288636 RepID=UPI001EE98784|nr:ATP-binding cassette domain-containing protein [Ornithinimicrobium flavum]